MITLASVFFILDKNRLIPSQRFNRRKIGSLAGWDNPEENADSGRKQGCDQNCGQADPRGQRHDQADQFRSADPQNNSDNTADCGNDRRFSEKLPQNRTGPRAQAFADTNLPGSFRYGYKHNIHNTDAADQQTDRSDK